MLRLILRFEKLKRKSQETSWPFVILWLGKITGSPFKKQATLIQYGVAGKLLDWLMTSQRYSLFVFHCMSFFARFREVENLVNRIIWKAEETIRSRLNPLLAKLWVKFKLELSHQIVVTTTLSWFLENNYRHSKHAPVCMQTIQTWKCAKMKGMECLSLLFPKVNSFSDCNSCSAFQFHSKDFSLLVQAQLKNLNCTSEIV